MLDIERRELRRSGALRPIEPQVFDLLQFLIENRERVVSRDDIFRAVWRGRIVSDSVLGTRINAARQAIGDDGVRQRLIRTVRGSGFRFVATAFAGAHASLHCDSRPHRTPVAPDEGPVLAIRPFACISDSGDVGLTATALTEEIAADLHGIDWLRVAWMDSSDRGDNRAARCDHSRYALQGSVRREHDQIRAIIRMTDTATGIQLWAERFACDTPGWADETTAKTARAISDHIFAAESLRSGQKAPHRLAAWDAIVRSLALISGRTARQADAAQALLKKAIAIDPNSSAAFALTSFVATLGVHQGWHPREAVKPLAVGAAQRAIDLHDEDPWGHVAAGYANLFIDNDPEQGIESLRRALSLNPNVSIAHYLIALASTYLGRTDTAFQHADLAERLRPRDLLAHGNAGAHDNVRATACFVTGRYCDGINFARKAITQNPKQTSAYRALTLNSAMAGQIREAGRALQAVKRLAPEVQRFVTEVQTLYPDKSVYRKYVEAFRVAGLR